MTAFVQTILSWVYLILARIKKPKTTAPVAPVATSSPVTVETDHAPTEPVTVNVTVNEHSDAPPAQVTAKAEEGTVEVN